jgi:hypothetical protein
MNISQGTSNLIGNSITAATGFFGFVSAATQKFPQGPAYSVFSVHRIEDALACVVGGSTIAKIDPSCGTTANIKPSFSLTGPLNNTTYTGAGLLIADWALREFAPNKYYKSLPAIPEAVKGAGVGMLIGGIIGGLFDPEPQLKPNTTSTFAGTTAGVAVPSPRGYPSQGGLSWN